METKHKSEDLFGSIESSFLFIVSCLAFGNHFIRFGESHVLPNLTSIQLSTERSKYLIRKELQAYALRKGNFERIAMSAALRGTFISMNEVLQNNPKFSSQVSQFLKENCDPFSDLIRLLRNVYAHEITWATSGDIVLKKEDYERFVKYRSAHKKPMVITFDFTYGGAIPGVRTPEGYGINLRVSLNDFEEGKKLSSIISIYEQLMLAELCFNMCTFLSSKKLKPK